MLKEAEKKKWTQKFIRKLKKAKLEQRTFYSPRFSNMKDELHQNLKWLNFPFAWEVTTSPRERFILWVYKLTVVDIGSS